MFFLVCWYTLNILYVMEGAILDPALYLQPSPPMKSPNSEQSLWSQSPHSTVELFTEKEIVPNINTYAMTPKPRLFWPKMRTDYRMGSIYIPLTFSVSGTYGNNGAESNGAVGTSYASVIELESPKIRTSNGNPISTDTSHDILNSKATFVRIYGSNNKPTWNGWGNGKWGHYGKG